MSGLKKSILVLLLTFAGVLLVLAGLKLIQLSLDLLLYLGIGLVSLAFLSYLLYPTSGGDK